MITATILDNEALPVDAETFGPEWSENTTEAVTWAIDDLTILSFVNTDPTDNPTPPTPDPLNMKGWLVASGNIGQTNVHAICGGLTVDMSVSVTSSTFSIESMSVSFSKPVKKK